MFNNSPSICYIFFDTDDVIVTSVNAYVNDGNNTKDKYLIKSLPENKKYGAKRLFECFLTKLESWLTESADKEIDNTCTVV